MSAARPEIAQCVLIHLCTRPREVLPHEWVERLAAEDQSERLLQTAERTRIGGLVWSMLTPEQRALLPSECSDALQGIHLSNALRWQACRKLLVDSAESLAAHGIPVIALKGAALLLRGVYPDPGQRAIADLDLLVPEEHLAAAHAILSGAAAHVAALHPDRHLATIYLPGEAGTIEVHGAADHAARWPQTDDPFSAAEVTTVDGAAVLLPDDANLWLHLAAHGLSHPPDYWPRTAADLARLQAFARWDEARWREVWRAALGRGFERTVLLAAAMANAGEIPEGLRAAGAPREHCDRVAAQARQAWGVATAAEDRRFGPWSRCWTSSHARGRRELLRHLLPPLERTAHRLGLPLPIVALVYPLYLLPRATRTIQSGIGWRAALRESRLRTLLKPRAPAPPSARPRLRKVLAVLPSVLLLLARLRWLHPRRDLQGLLAAATARGVTAPISPERAQVALSVSRALLRRLPRLFPQSCLYWSLAACHFLSRAGGRPVLHVGVAEHGRALLSHAWVTQDGECVAGQPDPAAYAEIISLPPPEAR